MADLPLNDLPVLDSLTEPFQYRSSKITYVLALAVANCTINVAANSAEVSGLCHSASVWQLIPASKSSAHKLPGWISIEEYIPRGAQVWNILNLNTVLAYSYPCVLGFIHLLLSWRLCVKCAHLEPEQKTGQRSSNLPTPKLPGYPSKSTPRGALRFGTNGSWEGPIHNTAYGSR